MIKLTNINKYYNKGKRNEIHVINDTSIDLPNVGLVCLLGPSGCGKTTLLNVIGGLDSVNSGEITINDFKISKYNSTVWDSIRNRKIGYVFQNYALLPELTVYENLEFVLKMLIIDKTIIRERIEYALRAVGMEKYKRRKAKQLSGGQQQRVVIARALVKSPDIIIADEPTGNLDEKNTHQIMNIIKRLSKECLIILVTHENRLAEFYGDRIIKLKDGTIISDSENINGEYKELAVLEDRNIYLHDYDYDEIKSNNTDIKYFYKNKQEILKFNIIYENNTFYITSLSDNVKIKVVDKNSEVKIIDDKRPVINTENVYNYDYNLPKLPVVYKMRNSHIRLLDTFKMAFRYMMQLRVKQKLLIVTMFLSAIMVVIAFSSYSRALEVNEYDFLNYSKDMIEITEAHGTTFTELQQLEQNLKIERFYQDTNSNISDYIFIDFFIQSSGYIYLNEYSMKPINKLNATDYIFKLDVEPQIIIDKWLIDRLLAGTILGASDLVQAGGGIYKLDDYKKYLGCKISSSLFSNTGNGFSNIGIVTGICDTGEPVIFMEEDAIDLLTLSQFDFISQFISTSSGENEYLLSMKNIEKIKNTSLSTYKNLNGVTNSITSLLLAEDQILVNELFYRLLKANGYDSDKIKLINNGKEHTIAGTFDEGYDCLILTDNLKGMVYDYYSMRGSFTFYTDDKENSSKVLKGQGYTFIDWYQENFEYYNNQKLLSNIFLTFFTGLVLIANLLYLFYTMRSRLISRVYEIGVYRSLGVKKNDIYKIFLSEIVLLTLFGSMLGFVIVSFILNAIGKNILFSSFSYYNLYTGLLSFIFIWMTNLLIGLIPAFTLMRLTPAEIMSKYDI